MGFKKEWAAKSNAPLRIESRFFKNALPLKTSIYEKNEHLDGPRAAPVYGRVHQVGSRIP